MSGEREYAEYLNQDIPASTKFWELENKIRKDEKTPEVLVKLHKSSMLWDIAELIGEGQDVMACVVIDILSVYFILALKLQIFLI